MRSGLGRLCGGTARMLAAPGTDLGSVENAVVVGVHLIEPRRGALARALLGAVHILLAGDGAGFRRGTGGARRRSGAFDGGGQLRPLGEGCRRQR